MIKVLIVDDSRVIREFMVHLLSSDPDIEVVGVAGSGNEAIAFVSKIRPDVITMDFHMPGMDGYETTRHIMETTPTPIVIVSGSLKVTDVANSFKFFEAGALAVELRPPGMEDARFCEARKSLIQTVKLMSEIKVIRRFPKQSKDSFRPSIIRYPVNPANKDVKLIAIGASTGGPLVLQTILSNLPKNLPVPVLIVQHISKGFVDGFRDWLSNTSGIPISVAKDGENLKPGHGYLAPDSFQMGILPGLKVVLSMQQSENGLRPSVDFLFRSVADVLGPHAIGVLLTGMGKDGAKELKAMKDKGAVTIAQNEESCVVFGMPGEAVRLKAADHVLSPEKIAELLTVLVKAGE